ncbi:MAG: hypothetical protein DYG89_33675 [Caldilinea sp. CFX5]|nr:hypothetical protein [Caldilinea sp. CFX5]
MKLQIATVLACTTDGCLVQPIDGDAAIATRYSAPIVSYGIPIRPDQFVIIDTAPTPPETIFRWSRATVVAVANDRVELLDNGQRLVAAVGNLTTLTPGDEVVLKGFNDENRQVIDLVVNGQPAHADHLAAEWFPQMGHYRA